MRVRVRARRASGGRGRRAQDVVARQVQTHGGYSDAVCSGWQVEQAPLTPTGASEAETVLINGPAAGGDK